MGEGWHDDMDDIDDMDDMMTGSFAHDKPYGIFKTEVYIKVRQVLN